MVAMLGALVTAEALREIDGWMGQAERKNKLHMRFSFSVGT